MSSQNAVMTAAANIFEVDADGNLIASVIPRTDTLANLLAITDAGDGEVATATNENARVVYLGDPISVPKPFFKNGCELLAAVELSGSSFATGVDTQLGISAGKSSPSGMVDTANDAVLVPDHLQSSAPDTSSDVVILVDYSLLIYGLDAGAACSIRAEVYRVATTAWELLGDFADSFTADAAGIVQLKGSFVRRYVKTATLDCSKFRLTFNHDSAAAAGTVIASKNTMSVKIQST